MQQTAFELTNSLTEFLENYQLYGFKDKNAMLEAALLHLKEELELQESLQESANLYAEIYKEDEELQFLTATSVEEWPE